MLVTKALTAQRSYRKDLLYIAYSAALLCICVAALSFHQYEVYNFRPKMMQALI